MIKKKKRVSLAQFWPREARILNVRIVSLAPQWNPTSPASGQGQVCQLSPFGKQLGHRYVLRGIKKAHVF